MTVSAYSLPNVSDAAEKSLLLKNKLATDFNRYLAALYAEKVIFDPGSKVMNASTAKSTVKARSQFRMSVQHLADLYQRFSAETF